jgi:ferric-dicitrate binding protein FerR (iron transport regulator)
MTAARNRSKSPLAALAERELSGDMTEAELARGRERLLFAAVHERALPKREGRRSARGRSMVMLLAAALGILAVWFLLPTSAETLANPMVASLGRGFGGPAITFAMSTEASALRGEDFIETASADAALAFSDGSRVVFGATSRGRVADRAVNGARIVLTQGTVDLDIVHREGTSWRVEAGPHVVRVTGTSFRVRYEPDKNVFEVRMRSGSVVVAGPGAPNGLTVGGGQIIAADDRGGYRVGDSTTASVEPPAAAPELPASAAPSAGASAAASAPVAEESWTARVSRGDYRGVLDDAKARGVTEVAASAPLGDLVALADAARYMKAPAVARQALEAQRKRFGDSTAGRTATFLLGRIAEDSDGNAGRALELYDAYLAHGGHFASEALGRKMVIVQRTKGDAAARPIASAYLESFPKGAYASIARDLVAAE